MHILLIHQYFLEKGDSGGLRWNEMAKIWSEKGHKVTVIAGMTHYANGVRNPKYNNKYTFVDAFSPNIKVIRSHVSDSYNDSFRGRLKAYFSFVFSGIYAGLFKAKEKYDVILVSSPPLSVGIIALLLSTFKRIPIIFEIRDLWPESAIDTGILKNKMIIKISYWLERRLYKKAKLINALTPAIKETLIHKKKVPASKIIYIPNAADFDLSDKMLTDFDISTFRKGLGFDNEFILCYVGAHGLANNLIQLLDTAQLLRNENVVFILIGDGMEKKMLMQTVIEKNITNVHFFDSVPKADVLKFILAADAGISVLKKVEAFKTVFSNKTFDYMACKKPVLMAIDGISRELVETAGAGIYVEPENAKDFAEKIRTYLHDPTLIKLHGENGYKYAKKHFDRKTLSLEYLQIIETHFGFNSKNSVSNKINHKVSNV